MAQRVASLYAEVGMDASGLQRGAQQAVGSVKSIAKEADFTAVRMSALASKSEDLGRAIAAGGKSVEQAAEEYANFRQEIERVGDTEEKNKPQPNRWTEMASAVSLAKEAYRQVSAAAEFAYSTIKEGAQLELARGRFDNLSASIGTTSDALLNDLRAATNGMQSDAALITGATDIINLGLAKTQEGTVRLATAVGTLGLDMQQVVLTFANNSKARLDALGLSVEEVTAKTRELEANGFKGDAFDEAVLIGLEEKMRLLGDASQTTAGQLQILEASWANLTDRMKQGVAEAYAPVISRTVSVLDAMGVLGQALDAGEISILDYGRALDLMATKSLTGEQALVAVGLSTDYVSEETQRLNSHMARQAEEQARVTAATEGAIVAQENHAAVLAALDDPLRAVNRTILEFRGNLGPTTRELEEMAYATGNVNTAQDALKGTVQESAAEVKTLTDSLNDFIGDYEARANIEVIGIQSLEHAKGLLEAIRNASGFNAGDAYQDAPASAVQTGPTEQEIQQIEQGITPTGPGGTSGAGNTQSNPAYASGTDGWMRVPAPAGQPWTATLHGGEMFNVVPVGQSAKGAGNTFNFNITQNPGEDGEAFARRVTSQVMEISGSLK